MVAVAALAHEPAMVVRRLRLFRVPKAAQLHQKHQNYKHAEDRFAQAGDHRVVMEKRRHHRSNDRNRAENLCHSQFRAVLFPLKRAGSQSQI